MLVDEMLPENGTTTTDRLNLLYDLSTSVETNNSTNSTNSTEPPSSPWDAGLARIEVALQGVLLCLALFGNSVVIIVFYKRSLKLTRMQWFIVHLSIADLFMAFFNIVPQLIKDATVNFYGNDFLCKFVHYVNVVAMYASTYVLVMTAVDRYLSICHPLTSHTWTPLRIHLMITIAWTLAFSLAIPQLVIFSMGFDQRGVYTCLDSFTEDWRLKTYVTWITASMYFIPFLILSFVYGRICIVVWRTANRKDRPSHANTGETSARNRNISIRTPCRISFLRSETHRRRGDPSYSQIYQTDTTNPRSSFTKLPRVHSKGLSKSKLRTIKLTLSVTICFLVCWAPYFITQLWWAYDPATAPISQWTFVLCILMASLNSCTNPWIYLCFSGHLCGRTKAKLGQRRAMSDSESRTRSTMLDLSMRRTNFRLKESRSKSPVTDMPTVSSGKPESSSANIESSSTKPESVMTDRTQNGFTTLNFPQMWM